MSPLSATTTECVKIRTLTDGTATITSIGMLDFLAPGYGVMVPAIETPNSHQLDPST
jgi:hypothetical protein